MVTKTFSSVFGVDLDFPLRVRFCQQQETRLHAHEFIELVIVLQGSGLHQTNHGTFPFSKGDVFAIPRLGEHRYKETKNLRIMNVIFDSERLPMPRLDLGSLPGYHAFFSLKEEFFSASQPYPMFTLDLEQFREIRSILYQMEKECEDESPGQRFCLLGLFMNLIIRLSRFYGTTERTPASLPKNMGKVISHLNREYHREISLSELQEISGMSRSTLIRGFQRATGSSPIGYLLEVRLNEACTRLRNSTGNITEIAYSVGFNDSNYFARIFRKRIGVSPRDYRSRNLLK